jgi:hypothetical protein
MLPRSCHMQCCCISPSTDTLNCLLVKKEAISLMRFIGNCNSDSLYSRPGCHIVSKSFSMPMNTAAIDILLLKFRETWSVSLIHWSVVLWRSRKPNGIAFSKILSEMCLWIFLELISQRLADRRLIGRKVSENFGFLPGFGRTKILASFQGAGKWQSLRQWLKWWVTWTRDLLERCLRQSFGISSITQAFPSFKDRISFETSHGWNLIGGFSSTVVSRARNRASTRRSWSVPHTLCGVNRFSK